MDLEERKQQAGEKLKQIFTLLLNGPDLKLPEPPALPPYANEVDRMLAARVELLEEKAAFIQKVVWRTSAAVIGALMAGPAKDYVLAVVASLLGS